LGLQVLKSHNTRIIDEDVQRRVVRCHLNRKRADIGGVSDVERKRVHAGVRGGGLVECLLAAASDDDVVSEGVKSFCKATANARTAPCD
jgi:hypothetical protein